jgi:hypothetical protein
MTDADPTALRQLSASAVGSVRRIVSRRVPHFEVAKCRKPVGCQDVSTYLCPVNNESGKRRLAARWADGSTDESVQGDYWINRHLGSARWRPALENGNPKRP